MADENLLADGTAADNQAADADPEAGEVKLCPPEDVPHERSLSWPSFREIADLMVSSPAVEEPAWRPRFTLGEMLTFTTTAAVTLGLLRILPPGSLTFTLGLVSFAGVLWLTVWNPAERMLHVATWSVFGAYVLAMIVTLALG